MWSVRVAAVGLAVLALVAGCGSDDGETQDAVDAVVAAILGNESPVTSDEAEAVCIGEGVVGVIGAAAVTGGAESADPAFDAVSPEDADAIGEVVADCIDVRKALNDQPPEGIPLHALDCVIDGFVESGIYASIAAASLLGDEIALDDVTDLLNRCGAGEDISGVTERTYVLNADVPAGTSFRAMIDDGRAEWALVPIDAGADFGPRSPQRPDDPRPNSPDPLAHLLVTAYDIEAGSILAADMFESATGSDVVVDSVCWGPGNAQVNILSLADTRDTYVITVTWPDGSTEEQIEMDPHDWFALAISPPGGPELGQFDEQVDPPDCTATVAPLDG